jgi:heme oxygenase
MTSVLAQIRAATAAAHEELEGRLDVFRRLGDLKEHRALMIAFHGLYAAAEAALTPWLVGIEGLDYAGRLKRDVLRVDLASLGARPPAPPRQPTIDDRAQALGFAYVLEGATLGGQLIRKRLRATGHSLEGVSFFGIYGVETGPRWRSFCEVLEREAEAEPRRAVAGACEGFAFMHDGLLSGPAPEQRSAP